MSRKTIYEMLASVRCKSDKLLLMQTAVLTTVAATGFSVAFFHAAIPTHWLPFVLVSRERNWTRGKTLAVTALAGLGHVGLTSLLGLGIAWFGFQLEEKEDLAEVVWTAAPAGNPVTIPITGPARFYRLTKP